MSKDHEIALMRQSFDGLLITMTNHIHITRSTNLRAEDMYMIGHCGSE